MENKKKVLNMSLYLTKLQFWDCLEKDTTEKEERLIMEVYVRRNSLLQNLLIKCRIVQSVFILLFSPLSLWLVLYTSVC